MLKPILFKRFTLTLLSVVFTLTAFSQGYATGFKGLWYGLGQFSSYGDKYSGGLGTYTAKHLPIAIYSPECNKTFFTYAGTTDYTENHLLIMVSYFDHKTEQLAQPLILMDKSGVVDAHDNATIQLDSDGYIWIFVSGRYTERNGYIYRSDEPYDINSFTEVLDKPFNYPQPKYIEGKGFVFLFTNYHDGRELYSQHSTDGYHWSAENHLVAFRGHYQVSANTNDAVGSAFNWHKNGSVDKRTNLYYMQSTDLGDTWTTINGTEINTPLTSTTAASVALIKDYNALGLNVYLKDMDYDKDGNPVILYITSPTHMTGPSNPVREWRLARWTGSEWSFTHVADAIHNYDMGSLYLEDNVYRILAPTEMGPQEWGTGGEMAIWESYDEGATWEKIKDITYDSARNHSYARRPLSCNEDFYALWSDGNTDALSRCYLYYSTKQGDVYQMPYEFNGDLAYGIPFQNIVEIYPQIVSAPPMLQGYPAIKAIDGQIGGTSRWESTYFPKSIVIDYGDEKYFNTAKLYPEEGRSYNYTVELSSTKEFTSDPVVDRTMNSDNSIYYTDEFESTLARYARLTITGQNLTSDRRIKISEFILGSDNTSNGSDSQFNHFRAYPNPVVNGILKLEGIEHDAQIEVWTLNRKKIYNTQAISTTATINCESFPKGIMIVNVISAKDKKSIKIVVK